MNKLILMAILTLLMGCQDVTGVLNVTNTFSFLNRKGQFQKIEPGAFAAEMELKTKDRELKIKVKSENVKSKKMTIKLPLGIALKDGEFSLDSSQIQQPFDLQARIRTESDYSQPIAGTESCTYETSEYACDTGPGMNECGTVIVSHPGYREVIYRTHTTTTSVNAIFIESSTQVRLAEFQGDRSFSNTIYDEIGECR